MAEVENDWHTYCNWLGHRHRGYLGVLRSADYIAAEWLAKDSMPAEPNYTSILVSKRNWEKSMKKWRHELKRLRRLADERIIALNGQTVSWLDGHLAQPSHLHLEIDICK